MAGQLKLGLIARYLRPQRWILLRGALALVLVNIVGVSLPPVSYTHLTLPTT